MIKMLSLKTKFIRAYVLLKILIKELWFELKNWGPPYINKEYPTVKAYESARYFFELVEKEDSKSKR